MMLEDKIPEDIKCWKDNVFIEELDRRRTV